MVMDQSTHHSKDVRSLHIDLQIEHNSSPILHQKIFLTTLLRCDVHTVKFTYSKCTVIFSRKLCSFTIIQFWNVLTTSVRSLMTFYSASPFLALIPAHHHFTSCLLQICHCWTFNINESIQFVVFMCGFLHLT